MIFQRFMVQQPDTLGGGHHCTVAVVRVFGVVRIWWWCNHPECRDVEAERADDAYTAGLACGIHMRTMQEMRAM